MLRPSSVAFSDSFPPRGSLYQRQSFKISNGLKQSVTKRAMPAPGGRLYQRLKIFFALLSIARKSEKGKAFCKELNLQVKTPEIDQVF